MTMSTQRTALNTSWSVTAMLLDTINGGQPPLTFVNTLTNGPARPTAATRYAVGITLLTGKVALVPEVGSTIDIYDPVSNTIVSSVAHGQTGSTVFVSAVLLPNGTVLCIPYNATNFVVFDPVAGAVRTTVAHGYTTTATIPAYSGGVMGQDGLCYLAPGVDGRVATYDYTADAITNKATIAGTPAARPYAGPALLPNGDIFFPQWQTNNSCARYLPSTNAVTASPNTGVATTGAMLSPDGLSLLFVPYGSNFFRYYDLGTDTMLSENGGAAADQGMAGAALLPDGRLAFAPGNGQTIWGADPSPLVTLSMTTFPTNIVSLRAMSGDGAILNNANLTGIVCLGNGAYLLLTNGSWKTTLLLWTPFSGGEAVPQEAILSPYFNRRV